MNPLAPGSKPWSGSSVPGPTMSATSVPSGAVMVSVAGSKSSVPAKARATTVSGEVTKALVEA